MSSIVVAKELSRVYRRGAEVVRALDSVSFSVESGEFVAIVGPSGSGKSTLLQCLGAMDTPTSGSLTLDNQEISGLTDAERTRLRREKIGFVFQHFGLLPVLTVAENLALPLALSGRARAGRVDELLERVGLSHRKNHTPRELSGGEMQRTAIARALVNRPAVLLADEPTGALDSATSASILRLMTQLNEREKITLIVVTHNPTLTDAARRVISLQDGQIVSDTISGFGAPA